VSLFVAAAFAGCGTDGPLVLEDGGASSDATVAGDGSNDSALPDGRVPDATLDARVDSSDAAVDAPTRAPFGLDVRVPNPTCVAPARPTIPTTTSLRLRKAFTGITLDTPMVLTQIPGDRSRFFVAERAGSVVSFAASNPTSKTVVAQVPGPVNQESEGGLLGMAFHPKFAQNGFVYFSYTLGTDGNDMQSVIIRMKSTDNGATFGSPVTILGPFARIYPNHNGGDLHFGPDGHLYASFGDGGGAGDPLGSGQNKFGFLSKILRLDVDSAFPYAIPDGNPFKAGGGEPATYAYGFRNPYRFSFDSVSGDLWAGDVGEADWEEIDHVVAGGNYGWNTREGAHCFPPGTPTCNTTGLLDPWFEYSHAVGYCIIGGPVYRGSKMPAQVGRLFAADCGSTDIFSIAADVVSGVPKALTLEPDGPRPYWIGFGEDNDHELYVIGFDSIIYALEEAPNQPPAPPFPEKLSQTGCFDPANTKKPVAALVPYAPNSPFWSDGAEKERFFALPDGTNIGVTPAGDFDFPIGSVLVKQFRVDQKLVETRLFVRHTDGEWGGYSYEWNDAQTDATLLPANKTKTLGPGKSWYFPSRGECMACHTQAAGRSLGLEIGQLNGDFVYPSTNRLSNQLATLSNLALFAQPIGAPGTLPVIPSPTGAAPLADRARAYLHSNCSHCHRPTGPGGGAMDLRFSTPFATTRTCNVVPGKGDLGVAGAKLFVPGAPASSLLSIRLRSTGLGRMPPIGTKVTDTAGAQIVDDWIRGTGSCPP
jgi:uncharacterized repeat protein (TIGR03806 family)